MLKTLLPWLLKAIPMGGYRTFIVSILLALVGVGMLIAAFMGILPMDVIAPVALATILLGLQGFFGRAATSELEDQLGLAVALIVDTRNSVKPTDFVSGTLSTLTEVPIPDTREGEGDNTSLVRGDTMGLNADSQATGQGWQ